MTTPAFLYTVYDCGRQPIVRRGVVQPRLMVVCAKIVNETPEFYNILDLEGDRPGVAYGFRKRVPKNEFATSEKEAWDRFHLDLFRRRQKAQEQLENLDCLLSLAEHNMRQFRVNGV